MELGCHVQVSVPRVLGPWVWGGPLGALGRRLRLQCRQGLSGQQAGRAEATGRSIRLMYWTKRETARQGGDGQQRGDRWEG